MAIGAVVQRIQPKVAPCKGATLFGLLLIVSILRSS
jgi:hypothetical protein